MSESKTYDTKNPVASFEVEGYGTIVMELYPDIAPNTVNNFIYLIKKGFYDNNTIHRIQENFVIQGGDPTATGAGDPGYKIKGEFQANGFKNDLSHKKYVVSMARAAYSYDTAGSQFFIMLRDYDGLDGQYAAFGKVIDGFDVCDELARHPGTGRNGALTYAIRIVKATVDTHGVNYPDPEMIK